MTPGSSEFSPFWLQPKWLAMPILRGARSAHRRPRDSLLSPCSPRLCLSPAAFQPLQPCGLFLPAAVLGGHVLYVPVRLSASDPLPIKSTLVFYGVLCQCCPTTSLPCRPQEGFAVPILLHLPQPAARSGLCPSASNTESPQVF